MVTPPRNTKYAPGSGTKPSVAASGVKGKTTPISATSTIVTASGRLGRLRKGLPAVRMTERASVWVARDSTNQPVRDSAWEARKTHGSTPNVRKSLAQVVPPAQRLAVQCPPPQPGAFGL